MELCQKLGYKFEVLKGYKFQKDNIFRSYVERLYTIRTTYDKTDPMNLIAKLLINSLYGGMQSSNNTVKIYKEEIKKILLVLHFYLKKKRISIIIIFNLK